MSLIINSKFLVTSAITACIFNLSACGTSTQETETESNAKTKSPTAKTHNITTANDKTNDIDPIEARLDVMYDWQTSMAIMGGMIQKPERLNADTFNSEADFLANNSETAWQYFANKEEGVGSSKEEIWNNPEKWQTEIEKFKQATTELQIASQNATDVVSVQTAFAKVSESCQSCHMKFKTH